MSRVSCESYSPLLDARMLSIGRHFASQNTLVATAMRTVIVRPELPDASRGLVRHVVISCLGLIVALIVLDTKDCPHVLRWAISVEGRTAI